jgi:hypothetical protein
MTDDFKKQAEQARLARMQGIKLDRPENIAAPRPKKNRIEEAMGNRMPNDKFLMPNEETFMPILPKKEPEPVPSLSIKPSVIKHSRSGYARFLARFFLGLGVVILLGVVGLGAWGMFHHPAGALSTTDVIARVGKLVQLPPGETPTVATVTDLKPLAGEAFFKEAAVGDKVLIYATSSKAILYRPSTDKVIQVAPLNQ